MRRRPTTGLPEELSRLRLIVDETLLSLLPRETEPPEPLHRAMRYSVMAGGKRIRPILAMLCGRCLGAVEDDLVRPAAALELIHTYSLVHDDLPAMDDDDLRRGKPSCHKRFGEATAILVGDALLTLAFEVLGRYPDGEDWGAKRSRAVSVVARAAGSLGMVGGQEMDLEGEVEAPSIDKLRAIHRRKTSALLRAAVEVGVVMAGAEGTAAGAALSGYGESLGLAFQVVDDLLDVRGDAASLGKTPGKDAAAGKITYPALLGVEGAEKEAGRLVDEALQSLVPLGETASLLGEIARYVVARRS